MSGPFPVRSGPFSQRLIISWHFKVVRVLSFSITKTNYLTLKTRFMKTLITVLLLFVSFAANSQCVPVTMGAQPISQTVTAGNTATFTVSANGTGPWLYFWYKNGTFVSGNSSPSYTTPVLTTADNGSCYYCLITNCNSTYEVQSNTACVTVNASCTPVSMGTQPVSQTVTAGNTATFSVSANGTGPYLYFWYKNGTFITGATNPSYTTPALSSADNGSCYYCLITNCNSSYEVQSNTACVTVGCNAPAAPTGLTVTSTTCSSIDVSWNPVSGTGITYSVLKNNTSCSYAFGSSDLGPTSSTNGTMSANAGTGYYLVVTATNTCGTSANSSCVFVTTPSSAPTPVVTPTGPLSACPNVPVTLSVQSPVNGVTYNWSDAGSGTTHTETNFNGSVYCYALLPGCPSSSPGNTVFISLLSTPAPPGIISTTNINPCAGSQVTYSIASVSGATDYTWTAPNGWTGTSTSSSITLTAGASAGTISVTANNSCGSSAAQTLTVTPVSTPSTPGAISSNEVSPCAGSHVTYSISPVPGATSYTWTFPGGWTGTSTTNSITLTAGTSSGTISVTANNSCDSSAAQTLTVTTGNIPAMPGTISSTESSPCPGSQVTYSVVSVSGAISYTWTLPNTWTGTSTTNTITVTAGTGGGTISATANDACGSSTAQTLTVTPGSTPSTPGPISSTESSPCAGSQVTYYISPVSGATSYTWTFPGGWTGTSNTNSITLTAGTSSGTISVTANNSCGSSIAQTLTVNPGSIPVMPGTISATSSNPCTGSQVTYSVSPVSGATSYTWILPNGWTGTSLTNNITATAGAPGGPILVTANGVCGNSASQSLTVTPGSTPVMPGAISTTNNIPCAGSQVTYSISPVPGATGYTWTLPNGWSGSSTTNFITVNVGAIGGTISVSAVDICGNGPAQSVTVTSGTSPVADITNLLPSYCQASPSVVLTGTPANGVFTIDNAPATVFTPSLLASGTHQVIYSVSQNGCTGSDSITVTVTLTPNVTITAGPNSKFCVGDSVTLNASVGTAYIWNTHDTSRSITADTSGTYSVTVTDPAGCPGLTIQHTIVLTFNQPLAPMVSVNGDTLSTWNGVSYQWYFDGNLIPGATDSVYIAMQNGTYAVAVEDNNGCSATSDPKGIAINAIRELNETVSCDVYPNPNNGIFQIVYSPSSQEPVTLTVISLSGQLVYKSLLHPIQGLVNQSVRLDVKGVYILTLKSSTTLITRNIEIF